MDEERLYDETCEPHQDEELEDFLILHDPLLWY